MDALARVRLRIVAAADVRPHEVADPARERRIIDRLASDGILRDPLMVGAVPDIEGYVLLDGTNRRRALSELKLPYVLAQVIDYANEHDVHLRTWCHEIPESVADVALRAADVEGIRIRPLEPLSVHEALREPGTLAVIAGRDEQVAVERTPEPRPPRASQLRNLVDLYEERMTRVDCGPEDVEERAQMQPPESRSSLVAFPGFTRSQVVTMAMRGALIPAGITRHVILCGRALRVNVPLDMLDGHDDLEGANAALRAHVARLQPRLYREPTVLYDS